MSYSWEIHKFVHLPTFYFKHQDHLAKYKLDISKQNINSWSMKWCWNWVKRDAFVVEKCWRTKQQSDIDWSSMSDESQIEDDYQWVTQFFRNHLCFVFNNSHFQSNKPKSDKSPNSFIFQTTKAADVFFGFFPLFVLTASAIVISGRFNVRDKNAHFPDLREK